MPENARMERGLVWTSYGYVHYRAVGSGEPLVMLHTVHRSSEIFVDSMRDLSGQFRCYAIDFPCCGDSDHPEKRPDIADYATSVREVLAAVGVSRAVFLGQALGAFVCAELAATSPDLARGLIMVNCPFYPSREYQVQRHKERRDFFRTDESGFPQLLRMSEVLQGGMDRAPLVPTQEWLDTENVTMIKAGRRAWDGARAVAAYDFARALDRVACPTLLMWGQRCSYDEHKGELLRRVGDHRVVMIPTAGFFPQIDDPAEYRRAIVDFMKELSSH